MKNAVQIDSFGSENCPKGPDAPLSPNSASLVAPENTGSGLKESFRTAYLRIKMVGVAVVAAAGVLLPHAVKAEAPALPEAKPFSAVTNLTQAQNNIAIELAGFSVEAAFKPTKANECPKVDPEDIVAADKLLSEPKNSSLKPPADNQESASSKQAWQNYLKERNQQKHQLASELGLHVYDLPESYFALQTNLNSNQPAKFETYRSQSQVFLKNYGLKVEIMNPKQTSWYNTRGVKPAELETRAAKESMLNVMEYFSNLPAELVRTIGLKKIVLVSTVDKPDPESITAAAMALPDTIFINISMGAVSARTLSHEFGHNIDFKVCRFDRMDNDPVFTGLNNGNDYKNRQPDTIVGYAENEMRVASLNAQDARGHQDPAVARALENGVKAVESGITFISTADSAAEDKADTNARITLFDNSDVLNPRRPILESKFLLLFARLEKLNSKLATFIARMSWGLKRTAGANPLAARAAQLTDG